MGLVDEEDALQVRIVAGGQVDARVILGELLDVDDGDLRDAGRILHDDVAGEVLHQLLATVGRPHDESARLEFARRLLEKIQTVDDEVELGGRRTL